MIVVFTFCNTLKDGDYYKEQKVSQIGVLDTRKNKVIFLKLPNGLEHHGITGLAQDTPYMYAVSQSSNNPIIYKIRKKDLQVVKSNILEKVKDPHGLLIKGRKIYICSTGSNSIEMVRINDLEYIKRFWRHPKTVLSEDKVHLNSIFEYKNEVWASCFGWKNREKWSSANNGYLINSSDNSKLFNINHPHSARSTNSEIYYCESTGGKIYKDGNKIKEYKSAYIRGLDLDKNNIVIGISSGRVKSRSRDELNNPVEEGKFLAKTGISINRIRENKEVYYDLSRFEKEIFDVMIVKGFKLSKNINTIGIWDIKSQGKLEENVAVSTFMKEIEDLRSGLKFSEIEKKLKKAQNKNASLMRELNVIRSSKYYKLWRSYCYLKDNIKVFNKLINKGIGQVKSNIKNR